MTTNRTGKNIAYLLLTLFFFLKIAVVHSFTHSDDNEEIEQCTICDNMVAQNAVPFITPDFVEFSTKKVAFYQRDYFEKFASVFLRAAITSDQLFSRPPPTRV